MLARRVFGDGRTRAYAWGRAVPRDDLAVAAERLIAMSGQFEQRRLARPAYQLDVLDGYCGEMQQQRRQETRSAWRALGAARRRHEELLRDADAGQVRLTELRLLVEGTDGFGPGEEDELRVERERMRRMTELGEGAQAAAQALAPDEGEGASSLAAAAERAIAPLESISPELADAAAELRDLVLRLREVGSDLHRFASSLEADPERIEAVEARLDQIAGARRRFRAQTYEELLTRRDDARSELAALAGGLDPVAAAAAEVETAQERFETLSAAFTAPRASRPRTPLPPPSCSSCVVSAWAKESSRSSCTSGMPAPPVETLSPS